VVVYSADGPRPLQNKSLIIVGKENFMFFLPSRPGMEEEKLN
jgi:hypothetical protein